jgi:peptidoglycan/xylan/chitin deacetylase (PgdA/CDA1 family)
MNRRFARFGLMLAITSLAASAARAEGVALTFDDLPLNGVLPPGVTRASIVESVLQILKEHHVPQVYGFVNAAKLEGTADGARALKLWVAGGERVGNHTYSHIDLTTQSAEAFLLDVRRNEPVLEVLDGGDGWHWLRYPFLHEGDTLEKRREVRSQLHERGYRIAQVTLDYEDYLWNTPYARCVAKGETQAIAWLRSSYLQMASHYIDADRMRAQTVLGRQMSHVLLLHLGAFSSPILPDLLDLLQKKGFALVTLEEAQRDPAYESDPDAASRTGGTLLEQWLDARRLKYPAAPMKPYQALQAICQ